MNKLFQVRFKNIKETATNLYFAANCQANKGLLNELLFAKIKLAVVEMQRFFDVIIDSLQWVSDTFNSEKFENAAELGRIGKYYAVEDMLTTDPNEKFGTITLQEHYDRIAVEGQEYDPYTTMLHRARGYDVKKMREEALLANSTMTMAANNTMVAETVLV